jgi:hypothetical protein
MYTQRTSTGNVTLFIHHIITSMYNFPHFYNDVRRVLSNNQKVVWLLVPVALRGLQLITSATLAAEHLLLSYCQWSSLSSPHK